MSTEATVPRKNILDTIHIRRDLADRPFILPMPDVRGISGEMVHRARIECQEVNSKCRSKMRMSGLCKVEMSGFIQGGRQDGTGANRVEHEGTGAAGGGTRSRTRTSETGGSGTASATD